MKTFIGITGTTCVGKSEVAVKLAQKIGSVIISADSMQIYSGMDVGTAKITENQKCGITHYMLDVVEPNQDYSAFTYQEQASKIIDSCNVPPIVVGGTGLYFDSLLFPPEFGTVDNQRRQELQQLLQQNGLSYMQNMLKELDAESYAVIDVNNPIRVLRAIEIAETGGQRCKTATRDPKYNCILFVLQRDRKRLYEMIDRRVDEIVKNGLFDEVKRLTESYGYDCKAFSAIGYKEVIEFLIGNVTMEQAIDNIKQNTRRYAKRQITYFKKMNVTQYIDMDNATVDEVVEGIVNKLKCILI